MNFEAHLTLPRLQYSTAQPVAEQRGFHMSNITDDEVMGEGARAYCTKSADDFQTLLHELNQLSIALRLVGVLVLREKIEAILLDRRFC